MNRNAKKLGAPNQHALIIMDVFTGQMTGPVLEKLRDNKILLVRVPANMTNIFQPLDLTVNGSFKALMKKKFTEWYSKQIANELEKGSPLDDIEVKLKLSVLKPLHAGWLIDAYDQLTSEAGRKIIANGWQSVGISVQYQKEFKDYRHSIRSTQSTLLSTMLMKVTITCQI